MIKWPSIFIQALLSAFRLQRAEISQSRTCYSANSSPSISQELQGPRLTDTARAFRSIVASLWLRWRNALNIVQPETVIHWHCRGFRWFWMRKCAKYDRPMIEPRIKTLIREMCRSSPLWGAPRIHGELLKLGTRDANLMVRQKSSHTDSLSPRHAHAGTSECRKSPFAS